MRIPAVVIAVVTVSVTALPDEAARPSKAATREPTSYVPAASDVDSPQPSELSSTIERFAADRAALLRLWSVPHTTLRRERLRGFLGAWQARLSEIDYDALSVPGKVDHALFRLHLAHELQLLEREERWAGEAAPFIPFAERLSALPEARRRLESVDPRSAAAALAEATREIEVARRAVDPKARDGERRKLSKVLARRVASRLAEIKAALGDWYDHYDRYDPAFSWWVREPHAKAIKALEEYAKALREDVMGARPGEDEPIIGEPLGRRALLDDLAAAVVPYSPEELIEIANREFAWCETEMRKASREMGFGDDWKKALDKVRTASVEPGRQVDLVRNLALEAIEFVEKHDLVTVPPLAADIWGWDMLSPERQKEAPFFLGGETVQIAFPTDTMSHQEKLDSLRANNLHFSRAVVHHELIPGHHLQGFMNSRYSTHRRAFRTPFWTEGWALWFEFLLWDRRFPRSPDDRVGMLFWRMHRCARIVFSLSFHLGKMTPEQCIDFLVDRVGHERWTATGEVRRSFGGDYSPLYQAAYMLGALQFRGLHREVVGSEKMTNRAFHDRILREGPMPIEILRGLLLGEPPPRDLRARWRFAG